MSFLCLSSSLLRRALPNVNDSLTMSAARHILRFHPALFRCLRRPAVTLRAIAAVVTRAAHTRGHSYAVSAKPPQLKRLRYSRRTGARLPVGRALHALLVDGILAPRFTAAATHPAPPLPLVIRQRLRVLLESVRLRLSESIRLHLPWLAIARSAEPSAPHLDVQQASADGELCG